MQSGATYTSSPWSQGFLEQSNVYITPGDRRAQTEQCRATHPHSTLRRVKLEQPSTCLTLGYKKARTV